MSLPTMEMYVANPDAYSFYPQRVNPESAAYAELVKACPQVPDIAAIAGG